MSEEKAPATYMYFKKSDKGIQYRITDSAKAPNGYVDSPAKVEGYTPGMEVHPE